MPTIDFTNAELDALLALACEGAEGILTDESQICGVLGGHRYAKIAQTALDKLKAAHQAALRSPAARTSKRR